MGAELKITDAETLRLAETLAAARGESVEAAIRGALEREMAVRELDLAKTIAAVREISRRFREKMPAEWHHMTSKEIMDSIYDEDGLPV
ncbi:MAG: type II toxin-antitoxin system VapB family antitoxin [Sphingomonas sp.]|uniref:type II toxin-antitoxin system VapB family antitoxin n=1 Tax=Sphingomonas sp. TaxID=28214 RepID=UPI0025F0F16F|nr:type II toxin-antitoxin system VapB family antitoxin [Sphingomonas sp.]MBX9882248.1 type II toxin-antitoxin system VapB family antitoxin [Sphingomonas sp.]